MSTSRSRGAACVGAGIRRRSFLELCTTLMATAPFGLTLTSPVRAEDVAATLKKTRKPSVIWLHFQDCTGCSETLLRTTQPDVATLILDLISLDYHETLMAACGKQAEEALADAVKANDGKFVLVVEGAIPRGLDGDYMRLAGRRAIDVLKDVGSHAAAVIAMGSCASWGGLPSSGPNPTDATGVDAILKGKPIVNLPGCPPNPYNLLATVLEYAAFGKLPELDAEKRPKFAYDRVIHEHCPRRAHFDAGRFAEKFGDEGHRNGWCLYKLGCKGPVTHAACSTRHFNETPDVWPIGIGAPCFGCTERDTAFKVPLFDLVPIHRVVPSAKYPDVVTPKGVVSASSAAVVGAAAGAVIGATWVASRRFAPLAGDAPIAPEPPKEEGR